MTEILPLPIVTISCQIFTTIFEKYLPEELAGKITYLDYGLHRVPNQLKTALQTALDNLDQPSLVIMGYGLCGNGLEGLQSGKHTLLVSRADDCIALLLGSYSFYRQEFDSHPGTYYLTKGWLESGSDPLKEFHEYVKKYGADTAEWLMDQQYRHYNRLVLIAHNQEELEIYRPRAQEVARFCERWGMQYEEILGSDHYIRRLVDVALNRVKADGDFILIPPGGVLSQGQFLRGAPPTGKGI
jgi:hypothetical protein